jgi:hypothetical protein
VQRLSDRRDPIVRVSVKWPGTLASEKAIRRAPPQGRYSIHTRSHARGMTKLPPLSKGGLSRFPVMGIPPSWVALLTTTKPAPRGCSPNLYSLGCRGRQIVTVGASRRWPGSSKALMPQRQPWGLSDVRVLQDATQAFCFEELAHSDLNRSRSQGAMVEKAPPRALSMELLETELGGSFPRTPPSRRELLRQLRNASNKSPGRYGRFVRASLI